MKEAENAMLKLASQLREQTYGMCRVGPGPYGFGVCNTNPADIAIALRATPDPFEDKVLPKEAKEIMVTVEGHFKNYPSKTLDENTAHTLITGSDAANRVIAAAFMELSKTPCLVSKDECDAAFDHMAKQEIADMVGLTQEEAQLIADTRWYEGKTAEKIVDFQLYEPQLCMPLDVFRKAVETVLDHPIIENESLIGNRQLQAEYRNYKEGVNQNQSRIYSDMPDCVRLLSALEKELGGNSGSSADWLRTVYELNDDFEEAPIEATKRLCSAFQAVQKRYGTAIASTLYNAQSIVLASELMPAAMYLHCGGDMETAKSLAYNGFFMESYEYDRMRQAAQFMADGGAANDAYSFISQNKKEDSPQEDTSGMTMAQSL